jgi:hypothetical protein
MRRGHRNHPVQALAPNLLPGFDRLDALFVGCISFSLIPDELRLC